MSDIGSDAEAGMDLVDEAARKLHEKDPKHPLLRYWILPPEEADESGNPKDPTKEKAVQIEMKDRFWRRPKPWREAPGVVVVAITCANYYIALDRVLKGLPGDFEPEVTPKPAKHAAQVAGGGEYDEDDIPF